MRPDPEMERFEANLADAIKPYLRAVPDVALWLELRKGKMAAGFCGFAGCPKRGKEGPDGVFCDEHGAIPMSKYLEIRRNPAKLEEP